MVKEGTTLHALLVDTMNAFYDWQDATAKLEPERDWRKKTILLKSLIEITCIERDMSYFDITQSNDN